MSTAAHQTEYADTQYLLTIAGLFLVVFTIAFGILFPWLAVHLGILPDAGMSWTKVYLTPHIPGFIGRVVSQITPLPPSETAAIAVTKFPTIHYVMGGALAAALIVALWLTRLSTAPYTDSDGIRHLSGGRYFSDPVEASRRLKKIMKGEMSSKQDHGVSIGCGGPISRDRETGHIVVIGNTGGGKTVALKPMIIEAIESGDRLIIFDNKGDFTRWVPGPDGADPILLAPWDSRSVCWAVGKDINTSALAIEYANRLVPEPEGGAKDPTWTKSSRMVLSGLIKKLQAEMGETWAFPDLRELLTLSLAETEEVMRKYHPEGLRAVENLSEGGGVSRTTESVLKVLASFMGPVYRLAEAWSNPDQESISIREFMRDNCKNRVLVIQGSEEFNELSVVTANSLFTLILQIINSPSYPERKPEEMGTWLFMDEFVQAGKIDRFERFLEIGRSKGVRVVLGSQNMTQVQKCYDDKTANTIIGQAKTYVLATLADNDSREYFSKMIGTREIERVRVNMSHDMVTGSSTRSTSTQHETIPVIRDHEFSVGTGKHFDFPQILRNRFPSLSKYGGCHSIVWMKSAGDESDAYLIDFRFSSIPTLRPGHVAADWTKSILAHGIDGIIKHDESRAAKHEEQDNRRKAIRERLSNRAQQETIIELYIAAGGDEQRIQKIVEEGGDLTSDELIFSILTSLATGPMLNLLDVIHSLQEAKSSLELLGTFRPSPSRTEKRRIAMSQPGPGI